MFTPRSFQIEGADPNAKNVKHYNTVRLHSAIGYISLEAKLKGREGQIFKECYKKLEVAREARKAKGNT